MHGRDIEKCQVVFKSIEYFVPHKILDPEYYNGEVKQLKVKVRRAYNRRKLDEHFQADLKRLSRQLLAAKTKCTGDIFMVSITKQR